MSAYPPKVALVLGSGGARGWAHVGVIRALREADIKPDLIVGSSVGAILGAILAAGRFETLLHWLGLSKDTSENEPPPRLLRGLNWRDLRSLRHVLDRGGLVSGRLLLAFFRDILRNTEFSELTIPFAAIATDIWKEEAVILSSGSVQAAIAASSAVPGLFKPVVIDGRTLLDGGLIAPTPIAEARVLGADFIIASDINSPASRPRPQKESAALTAVCSQTWRLVENRLSDLTLKTDPPDILIRPKTGHIHTLDFRGGQELLTLGYDATRAAIPQIRKALSTCSF